MSLEIACALDSFSASAVTTKFQAEKTLKLLIIVLFSIDKAHISRFIKDKNGNEKEMQRDNCAYAAY